MEVQAEKLVCRLCGYQYEADAGRMHGATFRCRMCRSVEETIRRGLGTTQDGANPRQKPSFGACTQRRPVVQEERSNGQLSGQACSPP